MIADEDDPLIIQYNKTNPAVHRDGADLILVRELSPTDYSVVWLGFGSGHLLLDRAGIEALGSHLFPPETAVPNWAIYSLEDQAPLPWWIPDGYDPAETVTCESCGSSIRYTDILTTHRDGEKQRLCQDCYDGVPVAVDADYFQQWIGTSRR